MYILTLSKQILREMWARKFRSILALFGIVWGTLTVVLLLALGTGFQHASQKNIMTIADNSFFIIPGTTSKTYRGVAKGQLLDVKAKVILNLPKALPSVKAVSPMLVNAVKIGFKRKQTDTSAYGISPEFRQIRKINLMPHGRFINPIDVHKKSFVTVLGYKLKTKLFGKQSALGKIVILNNIPFRVIGVIQAPAKSVYNWYDDNPIIPYTTSISLFGDQRVVYFSVVPNPNVDPNIVEQNIRAYFSNRYHFDKNDKTALRIINTTKFFQFVKWFFIGVQIFLGICGILTLGVGSLGVANIMFLIVAERTKEIGLRMAIGACDWHILLQIIFEALIIVGLGGLLGFLLAYSITGVLQHAGLPEWLGRPAVSGAVVVITVSILAFLGLISGYFPARRAAKMDPVSALSFR